MIPVHKPDATEVVLLAGSCSLDDVDPWHYQPTKDRLVIGVSGAGMIGPSDYVLVNEPLGIKLYDKVLTDQQLLVCGHHMQRDWIKGTRHIMLMDHITGTPQETWYGHFAMELARQIGATRLTYVGVDMQFWSIYDQVIRYSYKASEMYRKYLPKDVYDERKQHLAHTQGAWKFGIPVNREIFARHRLAIRLALQQFPEMKDILDCKSAWNWTTELYNDCQ